MSAINNSGHSISRSTLAC